MKKILSMVLVLLMLLNAPAALAEGMGVQVIGGPEAETESVSLDDFKLNIEASIEGYGTLTGTSFEYVNNLLYNDGWNSYSSGEEADYAILKMDILNITTADKNYLSSCEVKVIYDDVFEYGGWCYQYDWDQSKDAVLSEEEQFAIKPMYAGHFCFGCTLPNAVVSSEAPLKMIITIDGNEITYNIRK